MANNIGLLAGIVIFIVLSIVFIGIIVFLAYRYKKRSKAREEEKPQVHMNDLVIKTPEKNGQVSNRPLISQKPASGPARSPNKQTPNEIPDILPKAPVEQEIEEVREHGEEDYYNLDNIKKVTTVVNIKELPQLVKKREAEKKPFIEQFERLVKDKDASKSWSYAEKEELKSQNRFKNIIPYDHTRVKLQQIGGDPISDYINASFISGYPNREKAFIACHGPVERTMPGFWRMVWEYKTPAIIMVTNLTEYSTMKVNCEQYWPKQGSKKYGLITVKTDREDTYADYVIRKFSIKHENEKGNQQVIHYHYTSWPDHGVPGYIGSLLKIRRLAKQPKHKSAPVVVHCRAGIGRTGTFICLDNLLDEAKATNCVDVFSCVEKMRTERTNMVQTLVQYAFLYHAIAEVVVFGETAVPCNNYPAYHKESTSGRPSTLDKQFKALEDRKITVSPDELEEAKTHPTRNRDKNVLASSQHRVFFVTMEDNTNPYFNAVPVKGYKSEEGYIATQVPLQGTIDLFWKLVQERRIKSIVCVQDTTENPKWHPTKSQQNCRFGSIAVNLTNMSQSKSISMCDVTLARDEQQGAGLYANVQSSEQRLNPHQSVDTIRLFLLDEWARSPLESRSRSALLDVREEVMRWQGASDASILVLCMNGAAESGVFIATSFAIDMANCEQEVDISHITKQIRFTRPQLLPTKDHYKFVHDVMLEYIENTHTYGNFEGTTRP